MGEFAAPPTPAECRPLASVTCFCEGGEAGVQSCTADGMYFSECRCSCTPGERDECSCESGVSGLRECHESGEFWGPCQCLSEEEWRRRDSIDNPPDPRCSTGETYCPDVGCVNLSNSAENCGMCGRTCEGCDRCFRGACTEVCCTSETNCGTEWTPDCSDLESDARNCGGCGVECSDREICLRGGCVLR
jgi:hypothetical protein